MTIGRPPWTAATASPPALTPTSTTAFIQRVSTEWTAARWDAEAERARYEGILRAHTLYMACIGIGESGHIGLNGPGQTDFHDAALTRIVTLPPTSRAQLERDEFLGGTAIPAKGITTTIPKLMEARYMFVVVPFANKAQIVRRLIAEPVSEALPATILKTHPNAHLYLDAESASLLDT